MRGVAVLGVVVASVFAANAYGQAENRDLRARATDMIVRHCVAAPEMSDLENPAEHCSCGAHVMVTDLDPRQLTIFTRMFAHFPDREAARAEAARMVAEEGYTQDEIAQIGGLLVGASRIVEKCER